MKDLKIKINI